jgi:hypothetical protein
MIRSRQDATATMAPSDKQLAEASYKGLWPSPADRVLDNTGGEPLAWMLRRGSAGSNTAADHLALTGRGRTLELEAAASA